MIALILVGTHTLKGYRHTYTITTPEKKRKGRHTAPSRSLVS